jgi:hypothetical protein
MGGDKVTHEELLRLRNKHSACFADTYKDQYVCQSCSSEDVSTRLVYYPCDVIKVLDELDRVMNAAEVYGMVVRAMTEQNSHETITELPNCDHWVTVKRSGQYGYASSVPPEYWTHTYCPKCGEKL